MKNRIMLFIPNTRWFGKRPWLSLPYAAPIITALLSDYDFTILDANVQDLSQEDCITRIKSFAPSIVLISALSVEYHAQYHAAARISKLCLPNVITVMGGVYPTVLGEEALKDNHVDFIFLGHAEERIGRFLELLISGDLEKLRWLDGVGFRDEGGACVINKPASFISSVVTHVKPDYSKCYLNAYLKQYSKDYQFNAEGACAALITSYGCPYNCLFCATRTISGRKVTFRPAEDVLEEIEYLIRKHGVEYLIFLDDCILADRPRILQILNAFIDRGYRLKWKIATVTAWHLDDDLIELMKRAGCIQLTVSVESGSQRVLNEVIRKPLKLEIVKPVVNKCREVGIDVGANFVIGFPGETWDEIRQTFRFAEECQFDLAHFHIATPLPQTDLYKIAKENNYLPDEFSFTRPDFFGFAKAYISTDEFTPSELMVLRAYEYDRINFSTTEKRAKVARMMGLKLEELDLHRKQTRLNCGIHF